MTEFERGKTALAFMQAGKPADEGPIDIEEGPVGAPMKVEIGQVTDPEELQIQQAEHKAASAAIRTQTNARGRVLRSVGQDVELDGDVFGLRELVSAYVKAKGTETQTADTLRGIVERFIEIHGDLPLTDLTTAHLREYVEAIEHLPAVTSSKQLRGKKLPDGPVTV